MQESGKGMEFFDAVDMGRAIVAGKVTSLEITDAMLRRIEALDPHYRSYVTVTSELALSQARHADEMLKDGNVKGPLHGVPIALKDLIYTRGVPTTSGTTFNAGFVSDYDATVTARIAEAGMVLLGKLKTTEGAVGGYHPAVEPPRNPWNHNFWAGVSSSGSGVGTAAGLCFGALGTDTGGSIRYPSAANGLTGLKPTWGRVSRHGVQPLVESLDCIGPMMRSVPDAAAMLWSIAGHDERDPTSRIEPVPDYLATLNDGIAGVRLGVDRKLISDGVDKAVVDAIESGIEIFSKAGAEIVEISFPPQDDIVADWWKVHIAGAASNYQKLFKERPDDFGPRLRAPVEQGHALSAIDLSRAIDGRNRLCGGLNSLFADIDLLIAPVQAFASISLEDMQNLEKDPGGRSFIMRFTTPFSLSGSPVLTMPAGFADPGMPVAFQLVGRHMQEELLLRAGQAFQQVSDWHRRRPPEIPVNAGK